MTGAALLNDRVFGIGFCLRLAAVLLLAPPLLAESVVPFLTTTLGHAALDPWTDYFRQGGAMRDLLVGPVLYLVQAPLVLVGMLFDALTGGGPAMARIGFGLGVLAIDIALLLVLFRLFPKHRRQLLLYYWLSPLVLFIAYWHGQTDLLPALLVVLSLLLLQRQAPAAAGLVFGLAVGAKPGALALLPFVLIYLWSHRRHRDQLSAFLAGSLGVSVALLLLPMAVSPGMRAMLTQSVELGRILEAAIPLGEGASLYLLPLVYVFLLYGAWQIGRMDFELLFKLLGVVCLVALLLAPTAVGWYLSVVPFLACYQLSAGRPGQVLSLAFCGAFVLHGVLSTAAPGVPLLGLASGWTPMPGDSATLAVVTSLLLSVQVALGAVLAYNIYRRGIEGTDFFRLAQRPVAIGIAGDSGTGKDTLAAALAGLFGSGASSHVSGDDYHLFERRGKLWQALTHLDPRANDLETFTRDVFSLLAWRPILNRHYDHSTGLFSPPRRIQAGDFVLVSGLHALHSPLLRQRLDVSIFLDMDEDLRRFLKIRRDVGQRGHPMERVIASIERRQGDYLAHVQPQREHADIVMSLLPADQAMLADIGRQGPLPMRLRVKMRDAIAVDRLVRLLVALCGAQVDVEQGTPQAATELTITGDDIPAEDIQFLARELVPHVEELMARRPSWQAGMTGLMQVIVLLQLAELLPRRRWEGRR